MERQVARTLQETKQYLTKLQCEAFSFDTETTSLSYYDLQIEGISFCDGNIGVYIDFLNNPETGEILHWLKFNIFDKCKLLMAHNIVFDLKVLQKYGITFSGELFDTMVAAHLIDETQEKGLKKLAEKNLGVETINYKDAVAHGKHSKVFYKYATDDAVWTWQLAQIFKKHLFSNNMIKLFRHIEMPFQRVILEMETSGVLVDTDRAIEVSKLLRNEIIDLKIEMYNEIKIPYDLQANLLDGSLVPVSSVNLFSTQQIADILFNKLKLKVIETTPRGTPSVGKKTIAFYKKENKFVKMLDRLKKSQKLLTGFFEPLPKWVDGDNKVRPHFNDIGTRTGRLSCSKPNLQQLPNKLKEYDFSVRECFIVPEGKRMITCDYSGQEIAVMAQVSKDPALVESIIKGQDTHLKIANQFYELGLKEEELFKTHPNYNENKAKFKKQRNQAKTITFGLCYGKGAYGFAKDFEISEEEAQQIVDKYFESMPKLKEAIDNAHKEVKEKGCVTSMTGRKRHFKKETKGEWEFYSQSSLRQAFNFLIQGYSADMIRMAANAVQKISLQNPQWELKAIMTIHDELNYEVKTEYEQEAGKAVKKAFETVTEFVVPLRADVSYGDNYEDSK